jgi:GDP-L-fucose synthase
MDFRNKKVFVAGAGGMVGGAIWRNLEEKGYRNLIRRSSAELNLVNQAETERFFAAEKPEIVILAAARVGGILANNTFRAEFIYDNLLIEANTIHAAHRHAAEKLVFLGSSCIYPKFAAQPINENALLTGALEFTNEPYAVAKIAGIKLCENYFRQYGCNFFSLMPTNLYGPGDNFDLESSHVVPALLRKFHEAKINGLDEVLIWGTGRPRREFLYVEDLADAAVFLLEKTDAADYYDKFGVSHVNVGAGEDLSIAELALLIKEIVEFKGEIVYDAEKPDGTPRKLLDVSLLRSLGWRHKTSLAEGLRKTYDWFLRRKTV